MKNSFFLAILWLSIEGLFAQNTPSILIQGTVYEQKTGKVLPYANIALGKNLYGTVSNLSGKFKLQIPARYAQDSLHISFIGFKSQSFKIADLPPYLNCYLEENAETLEEFVFTGLKASTIIQKAIEYIPQNYEDAPFITKGFYRLTSQKDQAYVHLSEAVFDIYFPEDFSQKSRFRLDRMRSIIDERAARGLELGLQVNTISRFDIVRYLDQGTLLSKKGMEMHEFLVEGVVPYENTEAYEISFDQKDGVKKAGFKGKIYIDKKNFAFLKFDFALSPKGIEYKKFGDAATRLLLKLLGLRIGVKGDYTQVTYKRIADKYYLSNVGSHEILNIKSNRQFFDLILDVRVDYVVTSIQNEHVQAFENEETLGRGKVIEQQNSIYDSTFWDNYNIILPNTDFTKIAQEIVLKNEANSFTDEIEKIVRKSPKNSGGRMDTILTFFNKKGLFQGNALIEYQGKVILEKSYNNEITKNQANSQYRIGSISKTFTSMLILMLEHEGKLALSDPIRKYLPDYPHGAVTIEQLLTHQSGIPNYLDDPRNVSSIFERVFSLAELVKQFCSDSLEFIPGSKFSYSNSGYCILALIAQTVTGQDFHQLLAEKICKPLAMQDTYTGKLRSDSRLPQAYLYGEPEPTYPNQNVTGAGGIISTPRDLLKWSRALDQNLLLPAEKMAKFFVPRAGYVDWEADYGYGWIIDKYFFIISEDHQIHYHPGTDFGFFTMFLKQPDEQISIILFSNTGDFPRFEIADLILKELNNY